jgi:hypothetical protein
MSVTLTLKKLMFFTKMDGYQKKEKRKKKCDTNKNVTNGLDYKGVYNI